MKRILFLLSFIISVISLAENQTAELRIYNDEDTMTQRFMGVVYQYGDNYVFIHREIPPPPEPVNYSAWRLVTLNQDLQSNSIYYIGDYIPSNSHCIVPFINGVMTSDFTYNSEGNYIQFMNNGEPENLPTDYNVSCLLLIQL